MKLPFLLILLLLLLPSCNSELPSSFVENGGVSRELAVYRKNQISDVHYILKFQIPESLDKPIISNAKIELNLLNLNYSLYLDFKEKTESLLSVKVNGIEIAIEHSNEHLKINRQNLKIGSNFIEIDFIAGELSLNRNEDFLYTLLVPDRSRTLYPCFDQPDIKAYYTLSLKTPKDWLVLGPSPVSRTTQTNDYTRYQFKKSDKMSAYVFSFVAGKFNSMKQSSPLKMEMLYRENELEKVTFSTDTIFRLHRDAIDYLENYTQTPFPFQKLDFATIPIFQYGGMEHIGAIQYRESALFLDNKATEIRKLARGKLIAHETSHMWFGDLVTMKWFDDVWMKEVFANFMAGKIINPSFPNIDHELLFVLDHYPGAYRVDRTRGSNPIKQKLSNLNEAGSLYGRIIYDKAPIMMRQLEALIGEKAFREGIIEYLKAFAYGNADWNDLINIFNAKSDIDLIKWSKVWVNQSGRPRFMEEADYDKNDNILSLHINQEAEDGSNKYWPQKFNIDLIYADRIITLPVNITKKKNPVDEAVGLPKPQTIVYNSNGMGYGLFPVSDGFLSIDEVSSDISRAYSYINLYENTLNGKIDPLLALEAYEKGILEEQNEFIISLISDYIHSIFWKYLSISQRSKNQEGLEDLLFHKLNTELSKNIKKVIFDLFAAVAYSEKGKDRLYKFWNGGIEIKNLPFNNDDKIKMSIYLAIYEHKNLEKIIEETKVSISNPDKLKRYEFLIPSLSSDASIRDDFFISFKEKKNREKESWVLSACKIIHHPLRQKSASKHLMLALEVLEEIQQTGDIFFPKEWLNNSIGLYNSKDAMKL